MNKLFGQENGYYVVYSTPMNAASTKADIAVREIPGSQNLKLLLDAFVQGHESVSSYNIAPAAISVGLE